MTAGRAVAENDRPIAVPASRSPERSPKRGSRLQFTHSLLATSDAPVYRMAAKYQEYMHLPNPAPLYLVCGVCAAAMLQGPPAWMMLVGASGSGKSTLVSSVLGLERCVSMGTVHGEAALLSATRKKERAKDASGGKLQELGDRGLMAWPEFTGMLGLHPDKLKEVLSAFREVHDGHWERPVGTDGGRVLHWPGPTGKDRGRVGLLAGVTNAIDSIHQLQSIMGERMLYYRIDTGDGRAEAQAAMRNLEPVSTLRARMDLVAEMFDVLGMSMENTQPRRKLTHGEEDKILNLADLGARGRSGVPRNGYTHEILDIPDREFPTRYVQTMGQLYVAWEALGLEESDRWDILRKIVFDSMPRLRSAVIQQLSRVDLERPRYSSEIAREIGCSESATKRAMEDLNLLGVVERDGIKNVKNGREGWKLTEWAGRFRDI